MADEAQTPASSSPQMVRLWDPETKKFGQVPAENVGKAIARGWQPATSAGEAATQGAGQGLTLGFGDELLGAANAASEIPQALREGSTDRLGKAYREGRDTARDDAAQAHDQHPYAYLAGQVAGSLPLAAAAPAGLTSAAALGAAQGLGETADITDARQVAKDVGVGALAGVAIPAVAKTAATAAKAAAPALENFAGKALLRSADLTPKSLGVPDTEAAVGVAKRALREPGLVPPVLSREGATAPVLARNAETTTANAGRDLAATYDRVGAGRSAIPGQALGQSIRAATEHAALVKPEYAKHVTKAIRLINPEVFDEHARSLAEGLHAAQARLLILKQTATHDGTVTPAVLAAANRRVKAASDAIQAFKANPETAFKGHDLDMQEVQGVINRLKEVGAYKRGAAPPTNQELAIREDVHSPAWDQGAKAIRGAARRLGGPEGEAAVNAARSRYGMNASVGAAAAQAARSEHHVPPLVPESVKTLSGLAAGHLLGGDVTSAGLGALAVPAAAKAIAPRLPRAIDNIAQASGDVAPPVDKFGATFGRLFQSQPPERRLHIDHRLQEMSPRYRELRRKAEKAHEDGEKVLPVRPDRPID